MSFIWGLVLGLLDGIQNGLPLVFALFKDARVAIGLAVGLTGTGVVIFVWLWLARFIPVMRDMRKATQQISKLDGPIGFLNEFQRIDRMLTGVAAVRPGWEEFKKHLIFPEHGTQSEHPIRATQSPDFFITPVAAEGKTIHFGFFKGMPDYFVGAGLIMTFVGLVAALYFAAQGLQSGSIEETRESLTALLSAATFKFITSISGIATSIIFQIGMSKLSGDLHSCYAQMSQALQSKLFFANPESVGFGQYRELKRQTELFEQIAAGSVRQGA